MKEQIEYLMANIEGRMRNGECAQNAIVHSVEDVAEVFGWELHKDAAEEDPHPSTLDLQEKIQKLNEKCNFTATALSQFIVFTVVCWSAMMLLGALVALFAAQALRPLP